MTLLVSLSHHFPEDLSQTRGREDFAGGVGQVGALRGNTVSLPQDKRSRQGSVLSTRWNTEEGQKKKKKTLVGGYLQALYFEGRNDKGQEAVCAHLSRAGNALHKRGIRIADHMKSQ